ncbi:AAA family ATPase [Candidatus Margulisiibacteriota bacterium]
MRAKVLALVLLIIFAIPVLGLTANEYYARAAKKYVMEDLEGAEADLLSTLEIDATHEKAKELLSVVRKELGRAPAPPPAPPTTLAPPTTVPPRTPTTRPRPVPPPPPRPQPTLPSKVQKASALLSTGERYFKEGDYETARGYFLEVLELLPGHQKATEYIKEIREKTKGPVQPPRFMPQVTPAAAGATRGVVKELVILGGAFLLVILYVFIRLGLMVVRRRLAEVRMQVCPDCKTRNPEEGEFCQKCGTRLKAWTVISGTKKKWFAKYGWKQNPFTLDVIPSLFTGYSSQVDAILDKISTRSGHILVYGDKGVGKTTLLRWLTNNLKKDNHAIYVARPPVKFDDLLNFIVSELKIKGQKGKYSLYDLEGLIKKTKKPLVILIDEAHEVSVEIEQQMRSLGDIEGVNIVFGGLPETRDKMKKESPPLFDRIVLETYIDHLTLEETTDLIRKRIENAGGHDVKPFTNEAIENIFKMSKGRPRMILKVCDWVIADAIKNNLDVIGADMGKNFPTHELEEQAAKPQPAEGETPKKPEGQQ